MPAETLKQATVNGLRWLAVTRLLSEAFGLAAIVAIARLVSPAEVGRAAVAMIFVMLGGMLTFEGFASALVQKESVTDADRRAATFMSIVGGLVLTLAVYGLTDPLWRPLFGSQTAALIQLVSPVLLIAALGAVSRAIVWRKLDFRTVSLVDLFSLVLGSAVSVALAAYGMEGKAIIIGGLAQTAVTSLLLMRAAPPPLPRWSLHRQREIGAFGLPAALAALVDTLIRNIDYAILAARLPASQVGFYYRAFNLGVVYQDKLSRIMAQIAFPLYSRTNTRAELRTLHERVARVHALAIFPLLASLVALAPVLVPFVFGPAWSPAVEPTQIMAVAGMFAAVLTGYPQVMLAIGKPRSLLVINVAILALYGTAITAASRHGLVVVSLTVVGVYAVNLLAIYWFLLRRYVGISVGNLIPELGPAVVSCAALLAVTVPLRASLTTVLPRILTISLAGTLGLLVYGLALRVLFPSAWADLWTVLVRVLPPLARIRPTRRSAAAPAITS